MRYICDKCGKESDNFARCECGGTMRPHCERLDCNAPATRSVYGMGYIAVVCEEHYKLASQQDKDDAIRFRYAEG